MRAARLASARKPDRHGGAAEAEAAEESEPPAVGSRVAMGVGVLPRLVATAAAALAAVSVPVAVSARRAEEGGEARAVWPRTGHARLLPGGTWRVAADAIATAAPGRVLVILRGTRRVPRQRMRS
jgi:hypothetical protein